MNRLTRPVRGLLVAIAVLAVTGGAVLAARTLPSTATSGTQHASTVSGRTIPSTQTAGAPDSNEKPDADETADPQETPEADDGGGTDAAANADRPQNHGWFLSQAANADTPAGFDNHGAYVSSIAKGDAGKPDGATKGAEQSAAGQAKGAAARAAHQH